MRTGTRIVLAFIPLFLLTLSCAKTDTVNGVDLRPDNYYVIENVPFVRQKDDFCGPAAMVSVMAHYGDTLSQDQVAEAVYTPALEGALISDMENFAREQGFESKTENGSIERLRTLINQGTPVILLVDKGKWRVNAPHYYVAYGYSGTEDKFLIHSGFEGAQEIEPSKLDSEWERMNHLMLVIKK